MENNKRSRDFISNNSDTKRAKLYHYTDFLDQIYSIFIKLDKYQESINNADDKQVINIANMYIKDAGINLQIAFNAIGKESHFPVDYTTINLPEIFNTLDDLLYDLESYPQQNSHIICAVNNINSAVEKLMLLYI